MSYTSDAAVLTFLVGKPGGFSVQEAIDLGREVEQFIEAKGFEVIGGMKPPEKDTKEEDRP